MTVRKKIDNLLLKSVLPGSLKSRAGTLYRHFVFFPNRRLRGVDAIGGVTKQDVYIKAVDGTLLHGWFFQRIESPHVVLVSHGNGGNLDDIKWLIENLLESDASVLAYDYRGYGLSKGVATVESVAEDGLSVYDFVRNTLGYTEEDIILYGQSIGSAVTCHILSQRDCRGVILQSGFSSLRDVVAHHAPFLSRSALVPDALDNRRILAEIAHPPLLLIHGTKDAVVPVQHSHEMFAAAQGPKELVLLDGACHRVYPKAGRGHREATNKFINALIGR